MAGNTRLNQILAIEKGVKGDTEKFLTAQYHLLQKAVTLSGISRTYRKRDDADADLPGESTLVQTRASEVISAVADSLARLFDVTAAKDFTNCQAKADVVVDGHTILKDAPVTYLLFLEKQLINVETFVRKLPTLDPSEDWKFDKATNTYRTEAVVTTRTKKVLRNHVKAEATDKHPAQVETFTEDVVMGYWDTVKFSGALPASRTNELLSQVIALAEAVKMAREQANLTPVIDPKPGKAIFDYLFR